MSARFQPFEEQPSDAPLVSCRAHENAGDVLLRRLDPVFAPSDAARRLFRAEIAAARAIPAHPALLTPVAWDDGPEPFLARPFAPFGSLAERDLRGMDAEQVVGWVAWLADALDALHAAGVVHGDPSPRNILFFADEGEPRLADPASSRRLFPRATPSSMDSAEHDEAVAVRFLEVLEGGTSRDDEATLWSELVRIRFCNLTPGQKLAAVRRLGTGCLPPRCRGTEAPLPPAVPVRAVLVAGPFEDAATHEQVRRWSLSFLVRSSPDVRAGNGPDRIAFELEYPEPCRSMATQIRRLRVPVSVVCRLDGRLPWGKG